MYSKINILLFLKISEEECDLTFWECVQVILLDMLK